MEMTKERLEGYKSCKAEIEELNYLLAHLKDGDEMIGNSAINDYQTGYPRPQSVVGRDYEKEFRMRAAYEKRIFKLEVECAEVEMWIEEIPDSLTRRIFRMYFKQGMSQKQVAKSVHLDRSRVSRKIDEYLKNAHKAQKAHV